MLAGRRGCRLIGLNFRLQVFPLRVSTLPGSLRLPPYRTPSTVISRPTALPLELARLSRAVSIVSTCYTAPLLLLAKPLLASHYTVSMSQRRSKSSKATNGSANRSASHDDGHGHEHEHEHEDAHTHSHSIFSAHSHSHGDDAHGQGREKMMEALQGNGESTLIRMARIPMLTGIRGQETEAAISRS